MKKVNYEVNHFDLVIPCGWLGYNLSSVVVQYTLNLLVLLLNCL